MKNSLGRDGIKLSLSKIITVVITMVISMFLSRMLTLTEYGTYSQILMVSTLALAFFSLGFPESVNYFLARKETPSERSGYLSTFFTVGNILGVLMALVLIVITPFIAKYFKNPLIRSFIFVLAIYPWTMFMSNSMDNILVVCHKTVTLLIYRISLSLSLLGILVFKWILGFSFLWYMILFTAVNVIFALAVYIISYRKAGHFTIHIDIKLLFKILKFAIPMGLSGIVGRLHIELGKLMIGSFFGTEELAIYTNAAQEMPLTVISSSFSAVLMPALVKLLYKKQTDTAVKLWGETNILSYTIIAFFSAVLFAFAPEVMTLLYSEKYLPGVSVFRVYSLVLLLRATYFGMVLNCIGRTKFILISTIASFGLNVILTLLGFKFFGFIGPAVATFLCIIITNFLQLLFTSKCITVPFRRIFPWKQLLIITIVNALLGGVFYVLARNTFIPVIVLFIVWACVYIGLVFETCKRHWYEMNRLGEMSE